MGADNIITMEIQQSWPAPAKLNLFLHITGQRADGYHLLQTVFQFLDFGDQLEFNPSQDGQIRLSATLPGVAEADDLTIRAAKLLRDSVKQPQLGVTITTHKKLPMGGGLGGGSSDAATTLVALNHLWSLNLSLEQLAQIGLELGADVPIFVHGHAAWAEGVGEVIEPIKLTEPWFLVIIPAVNVSTKEIFCSAELTRDHQPIKIPGFLTGKVGNDCQSVVCKHYPQVKEALDWLAKYSESRMTGTGACVFAPFESQAQAQAVFNKLPDTWQGFVAKGANRSPLHLKLQSIV